MTSPTGHLDTKSVMQGLTSGTGTSQTDSTKQIILNEFRREFHGCRVFWGKNSSKVRRTSWAFFLLIIYGALGVGLVERITEFLSFPVSTVISVRHYRVMTFPAVTICNHNNIVSSYTMDDHLLLELLKVLSTTNDDGYDWAVYDSHLANRDWNLTEIALKGAHKLEDMLHLCTWNVYQHCSVNDFITTITDFGVCYTFNVNGDHSVMMPGSSYGLKMRINIEQDQYSFSEFTGAGLRVLIHAHEERPLVKLVGFSVAPGFATDVSVKHSSIYNLQAPYQPSCRDHILKYSRTYTLETCYFECEVNEVIRLCGCKHYRHPGDVRPCDPKEYMHCVQEVLRNVSTMGVQDCYCTEPCYKDQYKPMISMAQWPSEYYRNFIAGLTNVTYEHIRNNFLELNIYFERLQSEEKRDSPSYNIFGLLASIGGILGVLCGTNVLTIAEIVDCILVTISRLKNRKQIVSV